MSDIAIRVRNLSKIFKIYDTPSDRLKELIHIKRKKYHSAFPALRNVNFVINKGDFVGIVGKNGAGKSTLLKILSRELTPTQGEIEINGTVSLLQLGAGFDPELSGIENAKYSCRLMGLPNQEIEKAVKGIQEFADIGEFFFHPVKTYSSGMHSRLSFACAVNVDPDILIVDEVLSVGDGRFAQKCLRKMHSFKSSGKTVIFVTHNTHQIGVFCNKVMWIQDGQIFQYGPAQEVTEHYKNYISWGKLPNQKDSSNSVNLFDEWVETKDLPQIGGEKLIIKKARILDEDGHNERSIQSGTEISVQLCLQAEEDLTSPGYGFLFNDENGLVALHTNSEIAGLKFPSIRKGDSILVDHKLTLPLLNKGTYMLSISTSEQDELDHRVHDVLQIEIKADNLKPRFGYMQISKEVASFRKN